VFVCFLYSNLKQFMPLQDFKNKTNKRMLLNEIEVLKERNGI